MKDIGLGAGFVSLLRTIYLVFAKFCQLVALLPFFPCARILCPTQSFISGPVLPMAPSLTSCIMLCSKGSNSSELLKLESSKTFCINLCMLFFSFLLSYSAPAVLHVLGVPIAFVIWGSAPTAVVMLQRLSGESCIRRRLCTFWGSEPQTA